VWALAQHHAQRCHGVANLCVPYVPGGFTPENIIPLADRALYPEEQFPAAQWDYQLFYRENFAAARASFEGNVRATVKLLFRAGDAARKANPAATASVRKRGGWFGPAGQAAPDVPRDATVLTEADEDRYTAALERNGFFGPNSWYMNAEANMDFAARARANWRLTMPVLFLHGAHDFICATLDSRLADPMRANCADLTEAVVPSGHWMAQEKPLQVNAALAQWLAAKFPELWPRERIA
jgi:pimeloyl-ACP methyl ester carboxylesterase